MAGRAEPFPWVVVAGGFHQHGGMDRANAALARYLLDAGHAVHLVGHEIDPQLGTHPLASPHVVARPRGAPALAERLLGRTGASVARAVLDGDRNARVVVNGGNCVWPDINWLHAVHAAWPVRDDGAPWWSRLPNAPVEADRHRPRTRRPSGGPDRDRELRDDVSRGD